MTEADEVHSVAVKEARPYIVEADHTGNRLRLAIEQQKRHTQQEPRRLPVAAERVADSPDLSLGL